MSLLQGLMAPPIINNNMVQGETFLPGQIFVFGGFVLRTNLLGHLEQIDRYTPGHQVRFGNLNYTADIRGGSIFNGFGPVPGAPDSHDEHGLDMLSDNARDIAPAAAPDLDSGQITSSEDGWMDPATEAAHSSVVEPNIDSAVKEICIIGPPDSFLATGPGPRASIPIEADWAPIMEFIAVNIF